MDAMKWNGIACVIAVFVVALLMVPTLSPAYAYSSSVSAEGTINASINSVMTYDGQEELIGPVVNGSTVCTPSGSNYAFAAATVSNGYALKVEGDTQYALNIDISGANPGLPSVGFSVWEVVDTGEPVKNSQTINLVNGSGNLTIDSPLFDHDVVYGFSISTPDFSDSINTLTLGTVKFTMMRTPIQTTVSGTSVSSRGNDVTISDGKIDTSKKAENEIEKANGGNATITDQASTSVVHHIKPTNINDPPTVIISLENDDNVTTVQDSAVKFSLNIPANMIFYLHVYSEHKGGYLDFKIGTTNYHYVNANNRYFHSSTSGIVYDSNVPISENYWIKSGNGLTIEIEGSRQGSHRLMFYVIMKDAPS